MSARRQPLGWDRFGVMHAAAMWSDQWWSTWGTALTSVAVALLALGGVVWSTNRSAKATRDAEDKRAANAIDAENIRHANGLAADREQRYAADRHHVYAEFSGVALRLSDVLLDVQLFATAIPAVTNLKSQVQAQFAEAMKAHEDLRGDITLFGSTQVRESSEEIRSKVVASAFLLRNMAGLSMTRDVLVKSGRDLARIAEEARDLCSVARERMRDELEHGVPAVPAPGAPVPVDPDRR